MSELITRHIEELQNFASSNDALGRMQKMEDFRQRILVIAAELDDKAKSGPGTISIPKAQWSEISEKLKGISGLIGKEQAFLKGLATHIDKVGLDTEAVLTRQKLMHAQELEHDKNMKRQSRRSAVWQRIQTTVAIIAIMMLTLLFATWQKLPVPRLIAPVTAGAQLTCKEEKEANVDALRILFGSSGVIALPR